MTSRPYLADAPPWRRMSPIRSWLDKMLATQARTGAEIFWLTIELRNHHNR